MTLVQGENIDRDKLMILKLVEASALAIEGDLTDTIEDKSDKEDFNILKASIATDTTEAVLDWAHEDYKTEPSCNKEAR